MPQSARGNCSAWKTSKNKMKCSECGAWTFVIETRYNKAGEKKRRYECANGHRFSTLELKVDAKKGNK